MVSLQFSTEQDIHNVNRSMTQTNFSNICFQYVVTLQGKCEFGQDCCLRHDYSPEGTIENARKTILCVYLSKPKGCQHGSNCIFAHSEEEIQASLESSNASSMLQGNIEAQHEQETNEEDYMCGICHSNIRSEGKRFALLENCSHCYCVECMKEWHAARKHKAMGQKHHEIRHSCPECRIESMRIEASTVFLDGEEKIKLFQKCDKKRSLKPCKYFKGKIGTCRYGPRCLYAHLDREGNDLKSKDVRKIRENKKKVSLPKHCVYNDRGERIRRWGFPFADDGRPSPMTLQEIQQMIIERQLIRHGLLEPHAIIDWDTANLMMNSLLVQADVLGIDLNALDEEESSNDVSDHSSNDAGDLLNNLLSRF